MASSAPPPLVLDAAFVMSSPHRHRRLLLCARRSFPAVSTSGHTRAQPRPPCASLLLPHVFLLRTLPPPRWPCSSRASSSQCRAGLVGSLQLLARLTMPCCARAVPGPAWHCSCHVVSAHRSGVRTQARHRHSGRASLTQLQCGPCLAWAVLIALPIWSSLLVAMEIYIMRDTIFHEKKYYL